MAEHNVFVLLKPDSFARGLVGEIISRFENRGFAIIRMRMQVPSREVVSKHFQAVSEMGFFQELVDFMISGNVLALELKGNLQVARKIVGDVASPESGSIRGDYSCKLPQNLVHCSDNIIDSKREINLWFGDSV